MNNPKIGTCVLLTYATSGDNKIPAIITDVIPNENGYPLLNLAYALCDIDGNAVPDEALDRATTVCHENDKDGLSPYWSFAFEPEDVQLALGITPSMSVEDMIGEPS